MIKSSFPQHINGISIYQLTLLAISPIIPWIVQLLPDKFPLSQQTKTAIQPLQPYHTRLNPVYNSIIIQISILSPLFSCVCMYVCMYVCMHVCMYACMHVCMYACMHVCMYACMHVCMYACMHVCMHVCMYVRTYVCMYVRTSWGS